MEDDLMGVIEGVVSFLGLLDGVIGANLLEHGNIVIFLLHDGFVLADE